LSREEIKALENRAFREFNKGRAAYMAAIDEMFATTFVHHGGAGREIRGLENYKQFIDEMYNAFPDLHFTIDDMVAEGEMIVTRFTWTGTNKGEYMGRPPTNRKVATWAIIIRRVVRGKFVESWERLDTLSLMQQLGFGLSRFRLLATRRTVPVGEGTCQSARESG
jgi:predicted ester cyclase